MRSRNPRASNSRKLPKIGNKGHKRSPESSKNKVSASQKASPDYVKIKNSYDKNDLIIDGLYNAIHEFFIKRNFVETVDVFQTEILDHEASIPKQNYDALLMEVLFDINQLGV